jgi:UDP-glucose 4-epimerase
MYLDNKRVLITGGTGSLGKVLVRRILSGQLGSPKSVVVFSRDEAKQHELRMGYLNHRAATDDVMYHNFERILQFKIGDVRDFHSVAQALASVDIVFNAAALKQVPACEYFPFEARRILFGQLLNLNCQLKVSLLFQLIKHANQQTSWE